MNILIVAPRYKPYGQFYELPLGLAYLSSYLKASGKTVWFLNLNEVDPSVDYSTLIKRADILCTGGLSVHYHQIKEILNNAKKINSSITTTVGGGIVSSEPELMMKNLGFDIGIIGEGEEIYTQILNDATHNPMGLHFSEPIKNLDALPYPDYEGLNVRTYLDRQLCGDEHYLYPFDKPRCLPIISSRGCPYNCTFCFHPTGRVYRQRSLDNFFGEVEFLIEKYQVNMLSVLDELISANPERLELFCERMRKYQINWMTQMRADSVTQETIKMLKASGCHQISYGIESGSNAVLESMNKRTTIEVIEQALEWTYEAGIGIQGNLIFGDHNETVRTTEETLNWWFTHRHLMINLSYVIPYPGSELYSYATKTGIIPDKLKFIQQGCPTVALTPEIREVSRLVESYRKSGILPAKIIFAECTGHDTYRGNLLHIKVICPHCETEQEYRNLYHGSTGVAFASGHYRIGCRNCNQRFDIKTEEICQS